VPVNAFENRFAGKFSSKHFFDDMNNYK